MSTTSPSSVSPVAASKSAPAIATAPSAMTWRSSRPRRCRRLPSNGRCRRVGRRSLGSLRSATALAHRAPVAFRPPRTDSLAEFHHRLARPPGIPGGVDSARKAALQNPCDVDVEREHGLFESEAANGCRDVRSDAGQLGEVLGPPGADDDPRRPVQVTGAPWVAESLPFGQHLAERHSRQRPDGRPALDPPHPSCGRPARRSSEPTSPPRSTPHRRPGWRATGALGRSPPTS